MAHVRTRVVGNSWTWFEDYVFLWARWTVQCEEGRQCQVGMGVSVGGEPRGEKIRFVRHKQFTTVGAGSVHVRVVDGRGPCTVRLDRGRVGLIRLLGSQSDSEPGLAVLGPELSAEAIAAMEQFNAAAAALREHAPHVFDDGEPTSS